MHNIINEHNNRVDTRRKKKQPLKDFLHQIDLDSPAFKNGYIGELEGFYSEPLRKKNHTKTFIGGVICTLIVIYIIFPLADLFTDVLLAYLMK